MSPWWTVAAVVLVTGTAAVLVRIREVLIDAATVLDDDHGLPAAAAPLAGLRDDAERTAGRLTEVVAAVRHPVRLARRARRRRPWAALGVRRRATRPRGTGGAP